MLRSIFLLFVYVSFLALSTQAPFIATLGYVWVDTFQPQTVAYIILNQLPVAMIMAVVAFAGYLSFDRRSPPPLSAVTVLQAAFALWATATLAWAEVPFAAWHKWDWVWKTLAFTIFIPYAIRSRVQIEAFAQTYVFALAANIVPFGLKTLISGGGYGVNLGLQAGNSGLAEGGLLSTLCLMIVPLTLHLSRHGELLPRIRLLPVMYWGIAALAVVTAIGTYERSALVGLACLGIYMWIRSKRKVLFSFVLIGVAAFVIYATGGAYLARMSTMRNFEAESSAYVRILVWKWTLGYVASHPLGGSFESFRIDHVEVPTTADGGIAHTEFGRAFHSSYFEVLGECGFPGIALFLAIVLLSLRRLRKLAKAARAHPELQWLVSLSDAIQSGMVVFLTSGAFVGIAYQPMLWYFVALGVSIHAYYRRVVQAVDVYPAGASVAGVSGVASWRDRRGEPAGLPTRPRSPTLDQRSSSLPDGWKRS